MAVDSSQVQSGRPNMASGGARSYEMAYTFDLAGVVDGGKILGFLVPAGHKVKNVTRTVVGPTGLVSTVDTGMYSAIDGTAITDDDFGSADNLNATAGTMIKGIGGTDAAVTAGGYLNGTPADTWVGFLFAVTNGPIVSGSLRAMVELVDCT